MAGNMFMVVGLVFALMFTRYMLGMYDSSLCSTGITFNETLPLIETPTQSTDLYGTITGLKCSGMPGWFSLIYVPFIIGIIYLLIPIPFKV